MWTTSAMAMYGGFPPPAAQMSKVKKTSSSSISRPKTAPSSPKSSSLSPGMPSMKATDYFEPAIERPPSPQRLRQVNAEMKRASHLRRQNGHQAAMSTSSSLTSLSGEYPGWEQALESLSIVRRSSTKSIDSTAASSRERPESVYGLGKNMFSRRGRSKRDSSANSSSTSSMYSTDSLVDKESLMPTVFSRRKASRDDTSRGKVQISGPFNFQHVTHTDRDITPHKRSRSRREQAPDVLTLPATGPGPMSAPSGSFPAEARSFPFAPDNPIELTGNAVRPSILSRRTTPASGPRRLMRRIRSQDQLRGASPPPRPPRSPPHSSTSHSSNSVPPRSSSRQGSYQDAGNPFPSGSIERPKTSGGFRHPQPFRRVEATEPMPELANLHSPSTPPKHRGGQFNGSNASPAPSPSTDESWPLASSATAAYEPPLPDVPEEDENNVARRSQMGVTRSASLRGSQSVPILRSMSKSQRPMSGASETLGSVHMPVGHEASIEASEEQHVLQLAVADESWEDDIDYCYEHEAEANCDYEWERCSMDTARIDTAPDSPTLPVSITLAVDAVPIGTAQSPGMLSASSSGFEMPALSPVSQTSSATGHEALTPTSNPQMASNFSLPLLDKKNFRASHASSFKESHGFNLSPSLLIPGDFHQQMLLEEGSKQTYTEEDFIIPYAHPDSYYEDPTKSIQWSQQRSSTSTMATNSTRSDSTGDRHISANSSWSFMTRHTASSTSLNKMAGSESLPSQVVEEVQDEAEEDIPVSQDTVPELFMFPAPGRRPSYHKTHASESVIRERDDVLPSMKSFESRDMRRSRARTASLSSNAPPVGQYAMFPRGYIKPTGDRI